MGAKWKGNGRGVAEDEGKCRVSIKENLYYTRQKNGSLVSSTSLSSLASFEGFGLDEERISSCHTLEGHLHRVRVTRHTIRDRNDIGGKEKSCGREDLSRSKISMLKCEWL